MDTIVIDLIIAWNSHDADRVAALYAEDYVGTDLAEAAPQRGREGIRQSMIRYFQAFPDVHFAVEDTIHNGKRIVLVWSVQGTHTGPLLNIPPTGRRILVRGVSVLSLEAGKISRGLYVWDLAGLLRSMALLPEL